ncbi:hypothetical protein Clacol_009257 [Clathrus columnatus]|uniref:NAD(P)-binding protein n=1 Tax=Clathrus columnatus TaxID=1419009 RepID=A0AAV5AK03_9AGAM|nr:hypothetical protein Clacol_009257 [Clathrus columnatus]
MSIHSRVAIVTGAAKGIGRAIALRLARDGLNVVVNDLPKMRNELEDVTSEISAFKQQGLAVCGDVSNENEMKSLIASSVEKFGSLDVIKSSFKMISNAGIALTQPLIETYKSDSTMVVAPTEDWDRINKVNARGTFLAYKYAAIQMIKQGRGGRIVGASSIAGKQGFPEWGPYVASKFAVRGLTQTAAIELQKHGITVNAYCPGPVATQLLLDIAAHREAHGRGETPIPDWKPVEVDDIAGLVSFLVKEETKNITGQSFNVNAGALFD